MKPKNFPERKRQRQLAALNRLLDSAHSNERTGKEIAVLQDRTAANLRDISFRPPSSICGYRRNGPARTIV